jgi:hypothetical protein
VLVARWHDFARTAHAARVILAFARKNGSHSTDRTLGRHDESKFQ